ncbi:hypothetical protein A1Q2_06670 [Trichosporon asahii var. asahii CBS 8904]|uniref:Uncharacterized protein n=1 Tax=Trichosporon asahii var. asahii (strain CBS 8904) TaxID=1220162 RepID=K1VIF0_TRIAC|nr:hypothetical protein A1Q2_06670 [Trichosporon asahii var. asahii CBS 8904]
MTNSEPEMELSSAQPHPFNGQVEELQRLILASGPEQGDYDRVCQRAASELDKIASKLRDCKLASYLPQLTPASQRTPFAQTDLPMILCKIVEAKPVGTAQQQKLWQQAGRVAANLSADCDLARERLSKYGYAPAVLKLLSTDLPHDVSVPLTASLLNLTNDKLRLLKLTEGVPDSEWLWAIADNVVPQKPTFSLAASDFTPFVPTFTLDMDPDEFPTSLNIVKHSTGVLERFAAADMLAPQLLKDKPSVEPMLDFIEHAGLPSQVENREETDKELGKAKAAAARTLVFLMSETEVPAWLWERVERWFDQDAQKRPDLVSCALLAYGNRARSDAASIATLKSPSLLPRLVHLLNPKSPLIVQHALLGLLRNLSIPEANRKPLGDAGVVEGVVGLEPWTEQRDVVGAVQGAAIGVVKALVRDPANAIRFANTSGPQDLLSLIDRTSDPALSLEATRVFVNAIRSLSQGPIASSPEAKEALEAYTSADALDAVAGLLAAPYPVLMNEGLVALSLASLSQKSATAPAPNASSTQADDGKGAKRVDLEQTAKLRPVDKLVKILDPSPASDNVGPEIKANAGTLVKSVGGKVADTIKGGLKNEAEIIAMDK